MGKVATLLGMIAVLTLTGSAGADPVSVSDIPVRPGPVQSVHGFAATYERQNPGSVPIGTNDFDCRPDAARPHPVVLLHGTDSSAYNDFAAIAPRLSDAGFCVFALNYGGDPTKKSYGTEDLRLSGPQVADFVATVLARTGASKVDIVGYSQGATVARYYVNRLGGAPYVDQWIGIASPTYGGTMYGAGTVAGAIPGVIDALTPALTLAVVQQMAGSAFLAELNSGGDTVPGVRYTTIGSRVDEMIQPFDNIALRGPGATNLVIQDLCPTDLTGHFQLVYDPFTIQLLLNTLDPANASTPECVIVPLGTGMAEVIGSAHS